MSFWGIELLPGKKYEQTCDDNLNVTAAVLAATASHGGRNSVQAEVDGNVFTIANLKIESKEQKSLDLFFEQGETVTFFITGSDPVHLSGYYQPQEMPFDMDDEEGMDEEELQRQLALGMNDESFDDSEEEEAPKPAEKKNQKQQQPAKGTPNAKNNNNQKAKAEASPAPQGKRKGEANTPNAKKGKSTPESPTATSTSAPGTPTADKSLSKQMPNGLRITDITIGSGDPVKNGAFVRVKYVGRLENGKKFDSCEKASGFRFRLGVGEVIKGWDHGVKGMRVGGKRTLVIPAALGYGSRGAPPDIPPNATLHFDVECVGAN